MTTPALFVRTAYVLDDHGRMLHTREPSAEYPPLLTIVRSARHSVFAVRADAGPLAPELVALALREPPTSDARAMPRHRARYLELAGPGAVEFAGPALRFGELDPRCDGIVEVLTERELARHFSGWVPGEIARGRAPVCAVVDDGAPVSVCFCARRSDEAAEAGVETAPAVRGRGYAPRVVAAWAIAVRREGLVPLYSTAWTNTASLAVARKLGLVQYASIWNVSD